MNNIFEQLNNKPTIIFLFIAFLVLVVLFAKYITSLLEVISARTKFSKAFIGGVLMSLVVSLPELISSIYGGIQQDMLFGLYNESGSNAMQAFLLATVVLIIFSIECYRNKKHWAPKNIESSVYKSCFQEIKFSNKLLLIFIVLIYAFIALNIWIPAIGKNLYIPGINISIASILPFALWLGYVIYSLTRKSSSVVNPDIYHKKEYHWNKAVLWLVFLGMSALLIMASYCNSSLVDRMDEVFNIPEGSSVTILLSLSTSAPEIVTFFFLSLRKEYYLGLATIAGGSLVNASFTFYTDCIISGKSSFALYYDYFNDPLRASEALRMRYWILLIVFMACLLVIASFKRVNKNKMALTIDLATISASYIIVYAVLTALI